MLKAPLKRILDQGVIWGYVAEPFCTKMVRPLCTKVVRYPTERVGNKTYSLTLN